MDINSSVYVSGSSSIADFRGVAKAMSPVGVVSMYLSPNVKREMASYNAIGGRIFVDSGEFGAFQDGRDLDHDKVLAEYEELAGLMVRPGHLVLVAPDKIGNMDETARLQRRYISKLRSLVKNGIELMIPLQKGWSVSQYVDHCSWLRSILGDFTVAFASKEKAWTLKELMPVAQALAPARIHLLGAGMDKFLKYAGALTFNMENVIVTGDANRLRSMIGKNRELTGLVDSELRELAKEFRSVLEESYDETEEMWSVYNEPEFLNKNQAKGLAMALGITDEKELQCFVKASQTVSKGDSLEDSSYGCELGNLLERIDFGQVRFFFLVMGTIQLHVDREIKELSPQIRTKCITTVINNDMQSRKRRFDLESSQFGFDFREAA